MQLFIFYEPITKYIYCHRLSIHLPHIKKNVWSFVLKFVFSFFTINTFFIGHSLFNFKDIPFAINLLICNLLLLSKFNFLESSIRSREIIQLGFIFSLPSLIRLNGLLFSGLTVAYLILINLKKQNQSTYSEHH